MCQHSVSRRGFFQRMALGASAATPILELAWRRAALFPDYALFTATAKIRPVPAG